MTYYQHHIFICTNQKNEGRTCCANTGGKLYFDYLKAKLQALDMHGPGKIRISQSGCLGRCSQGPCLLIYPEGTWYSYQAFADLDEIIQCDLINHQRVTRLMIEEK